VAVEAAEEDHVLEEAAVEAAWHFHLLLFLVEQQEAWEAPEGGAAHIDFVVDLVEPEVLGLHPHLEQEVELVRIVAAGAAWEELVRIVAAGAAWEELVRIVAAGAAFEELVRSLAQEAYLWLALELEVQGAYLFASANSFQAYLLGHQEGRSVNQVLGQDS
jgi:hypothetical protein